LGTFLDHTNTGKIQRNTLQNSAQFDIVYRDQFFSHTSALSISGSGKMMYAESQITFFEKHFHSCASFMVWEIPGCIYCSGSHVLPDSEQCKRWLSCGKYVTRFVLVGPQTVVLMQVKQKVMRQEATLRPESKFNNSLPC
jgi:hypothetical protein